MLNESITVGRGVELNRLHQWMAQAVDGHPQIVFVSGEAGVGKSHVIDAFVRQAVEEDGRLIVAKGYCNAQLGRADPLLPFRMIATTLFSESYRGQRSANATNLAHAARSFLREIAPDAIEAFFPPLSFAIKVAQAIGAARNESQQQRRPTPADVDVQSRAMAFEEFCRLLFRAAQEAPLLLVIEDLHWADESTIELLFHLARSWKHQPMLLLATYRSSDLQSSLRGEHPLLRVERELTRYGVGQRLNLDWMAEDAVREWVGRMYVPNRIPGSFVRWLHEHTGGNPFFINETLHDLEERRLVAQEPTGMWYLAQPIDKTTADLPASVSAVLEQRLARLDQRLRDMLLCGSVEGQSFTAQVVARVCQMDIDEAIHTLTDTLGTQYGLVIAREETYIAPGRMVAPFEFRHALMHVHLYNSIDLGRRRWLHRRVGETLEQLCEGVETEASAALARHFAEAGVHAKALEYGIKAARRAERMHDYQASRQLLRQAISLLSKTHAPPQTQAEAWRYLGRAELFTGSFAEGERCYRAALEIAQRAELREQEATLMADLGYCYLETDRSSQAVSMLHKAMKLNQDLGNHRQATDNMVYLASALSRSERQDLAYALLTKTVQQFKGLGALDGLAVAQRNLGVNYRREGDFERSVQHLEEAARLDAEIGDQFWEATDYTELGHTYLMLKNDDHKAMSYYRKSLDISRKISKIHEECHVMFSIGRLLAMRGDWNRARSYVDEGLRLAEIVEEAASVIRCYWYRGIIRYYQGQRIDAIADYEYLLTFGVHDALVKWGILYNLGTLRRSIGDLDGALDAYRQSAELLLEIVSKVPPQNQRAFFMLRRRYYVFAMMMQTAAHANKLETVKDIVRRLPDGVLDAIEGDTLPRFYWGVNTWV